ncbi:hypothetical protein GCM10028809_53870 [Spirosoma gilvum]
MDGFIHLIDFPKDQQFDGVQYQKERNGKRRNPHDKQHTTRNTFDECEESERQCRNQASQQKSNNAGTERHETKVKRAKE